MQAWRQPEILLLADALSSTRFLSFYSFIYFKNDPEPNDALWHHFAELSEIFLLLSGKSDLAILHLYELVILKDRFVFSLATNLKSVAILTWLQETMPSWNTGLWVFEGVICVTTAGLLTWSTFLVVFALYVVSNSTWNWGLTLSSPPNNPSILIGAAAPSLANQSQERIEKNAIIASSAQHSEQVL